ncbi:MAG: hypothetical protein GY765_17960 [bacterium]|nr:hypothetical protein [bacterium]
MAQGTMKKALMVLLIFCFAVILQAENLRFTLYGNYMSITEETFKNEYGGQKLFPQGKISFRIKGNFYLWGSCGYLPATRSWNEWSHKGLADPDINVDKSSNNLLLTGGIGYWVGYFNKNDMALKIEIGAGNASRTVSETATSNTSNQDVRSLEEKLSNMCYTANLGGTYGLLKNVFAEAALGFYFIPETIADKKKNTGGFTFSVGIGVKF